MSTREKVELDSVKESKENPVMDTIDEYSLEWHGISAEHVHESSLILPLCVMN